MAHAHLRSEGYALKEVKPVDPERSEAEVEAESAAGIANLLDMQAKGLA